MNIADLDMTKAETVALVSTKRAGLDRWSELQIWYLPNADGRAYVSEARGHSSRPGEVTKRTRIYVGSIDRAMSIFNDGDAGDSLKVQAEDWIDRNPGRVAADIRRLRTEERERATPGAPDPAHVLLRKCAETFRRYEKLHMDKGTPEALRKSQHNAGLAAEIERFLDPSDA